MKICNRFWAALIIAFISCADSKSINDIADYESTGKEIRRGSIDAYKTMKILCLDYPPTEIIKWAKYAADTLKYAPANLDALKGYLHSNGIYIDTFYLSQVRDQDRAEVLKFFKKAKLLRVEGFENYFLKN